MHILSTWPLFATSLLYFATGVWGYKGKLVMAQHMMAGMGGLGKLYSPVCNIQRMVYMEWHIIPDFGYQDTDNVIYSMVVIYPIWTAFLHLARRRQNLRQTCLYMPIHHMNRKFLGRCFVQKYRGACNMFNMFRNEYWVLNLSLFIIILFLLTMWSRWEIIDLKAIGIPTITNLPVDSPKHATG